MKQYRLVKVGDHYVALSRGNVKTLATLEMIEKLIPSIRKKNEGCQWREEK